jgi:hypothetical protein
MVRVLVPLRVGVGVRVGLALKEGVTVGVGGACTMIRPRMSKAPAWASQRYQRSPALAAVMLKGTGPAQQVAPLRKPVPL